MDLFNSLPDNMKRELLRAQAGNPFFQNQLTQMFNQEMRKVAAAQKLKAQPQVQQPPPTPKQQPQIVPNLTPEQLYKSLAQMKQPTAASTSKAPAAPSPQAPKPKSALSLKYKSLKEDLARDREAVRKVQRNRVENTKAKEFFEAKERMTEQQLRAIAEYCETDILDIKKSRTDGIPIQRMWWKRFDGRAPPKGPDGEELIQPNFPLKSLDENLCSNSALQLVIPYLLSRNSRPIRGQAKDFEKKMRDLDPRVHDNFLDIFDDSQPLMPHLTITDDMINRQEEKVALARKKLEDYCKAMK